MADSTHLWSVPHLDGLQLLRANFVTYAFKKHSHDYFVIGMVEAGVQQFAYQRQRYVTPPTGLIILNPGEIHDGAPAVPSGFHYRALYPEPAVMQAVAAQISERQPPLPVFREPVLHDPALFTAFRELHHHLEQPTTELEQASRYLWVLAQLIQRYGDLTSPPVYREKTPIQVVRRYLEENYAANIKLADLAALVHWNPYYLLRVFRREVGLPPHAYLEMIRIRVAQQQLRRGLPLAQVAYDTGFSSQSHFTTTFKRVIGVTPGQFAKEVNFLKDPAPALPYADPYQTKDQSHEHGF